MTDSYGVLAWWVLITVFAAKGARNALGWLLRRHRFRMSQRWSKTRGTITISDFNEEEENSRASFRIAYRYGAPADLQGERVSLAGTEDPRAVVARFPVGKEVDVYFDPNHPRLTCLDRDDVSGLKHSREQATLHFGMMMLLVGALVYREIQASPSEPPLRLSTGWLATKSAPTEVVCTPIRPNAADSGTVSGRNATNFHDVEARFGLGASAILQREIELPTGVDASELIRAVTSVDDGRDKFLVQVGGRRYLLVWADELWPMDRVEVGATMTLQDDDATSHPLREGIVVARHDTTEHGMKAPGPLDEVIAFLQNNDGWERAHTASERASPLLQALGVHTAAPSRERGQSRSPLEHRSVKEFNEIDHLQLFSHGGSTA